MAEIDTQVAVNSALQHHRAGRLHEAEQIYKQILAQEPSHFVARHYLGLVALQVGRLDIAISLMQKAVSINPFYAEGHGDLGSALKDSGRLDDAIDSFRRAISLDPNCFAALVNYGAALHEKGRTDEAIDAMKRAIALQPGVAEAYSNLGNALATRGRLDEAIAAHRQAIALRPDFPGTYNNLGNALKEKGQFDDAVAAYRQAIKIQPDYAAAHNNLAVALARKGQLDEAIAECRQAIAIEPASAEAYTVLGSALKDSGRSDEAAAAFAHCLELRPDNAAFYSNVIYNLQFHPGYTAPQIAEEQRIWNQHYAEPLKSLIPTRANDRNPDRRLRIGYVSPDFRNHVVGINLLPLFEHHDRSQYDIVCYSQVLRPDAITGRFQQLATSWRNIVGLSDEAAAKQIADDQIDILIDTALHMADNRLLVFARKPAPIQATFAGYPASTGLTAIDYRLSDPYLDPPGMDESIYSEKTIRLPDTFWCHDPIEGKDMAVGALPALANGHVTFGCLNNFCKINEEIVGVWANVLAQVKDSRLLLLSFPGSHQDRLLAQFSQRNIDPSRISFAAPRPRGEYLKLYNQIDVGLDSHPYNGHSTSLDSSWMGVPVITRIGKTAISRAGYSQLSNLGLTELAASDSDQFVQIAVDLVHDLPRLSDLRATLRQRMQSSPLMDAPKFARGIEQAYRGMWKTWCAGA